MSDSLPVIVVGAGAAGLAAAVELTRAGRRVVVIEKRRLTGGRAASFVDRKSGEEVDNCQHVLLGCCTQAIDLLETLGTADQLQWTDDYRFLLPDGETPGILRPTHWLPAPLHYLPSLLRFGALSFGDRLRLARIMTGMMLAGPAALEDATSAPILDWLQARGATPTLIRRFLEPVLIGAVNEELDQAAATPSFQVFLQGFLPHRRAAALAVAECGLGELLGEPAARFIEAGGGEMRRGERVTELLFDGDRASGVRTARGDEIEAAAVILALPPRGLRALERTEDSPWGATPEFEYSPITGINLWLDREVLEVPHAALLESPIHWVFAKPVSEKAATALGARQRLHVVISASRRFTKLRHPEQVELTRRELTRFFPRLGEARILHSLCVTENSATLSLTPEAQRRRPGATTTVDNLVLAGDWTATGWPPTIEGAVRSGRTAAALIRGRQAPEFRELPRGLMARLLMPRTPQRF